MEQGRYFSLGLGEEMPLWGCLYLGASQVRWMNYHLWLMYFVPFLQQRCHLYGWGGPHLLSGHPEHHRDLSHLLLAEEC